MPIALLSRSRVFYGWWLVLVCLLMQGIAAGVTIYLYSIIAGEVEREFSAGRAVVMLGLTGSSITTALIAPKLGDWLDRLPIRRIVTISALLMGSGFLAMSFTPSVWGFVLSYAILVAAGTVGLSMLIAPLLLSRWFLRYRGLAMGIAALGTQVGGFLCPPLLTALIEAFDWRVAMQAVGIFVILVVPLLASLIVDRPESIGLAPDGDERVPDAASATEQAPPVALRQILRDRNFWFAGFGIAVMVAMFTTVLANLALFATDIGTPRDRAALLISLYAVVGVVFSPLIGRFCDRFDIRWVFALLMVVNIGAMALFAVAGTYIGLFLATALIAVSGGGLMPFWGALIGKLFDIRMYGRVMGAMTLFTVAAASLAPILSGWLFDVTGSYRTLFLVLMALNALPLFYLPLMRRSLA